MSMSPENQEHTLSAHLSGAKLNGKRLDVFENQSISMYDPARYKIVTNSGELAVKGADIELVNEELVVVVFADAEDQEHTLLHGVFRGLSLDGVDFPEKEAAAEAEAA